jgi:hypothetical protein
MATYTALLEDSGGQTADMAFGSGSSPAKIETFLTAHCSAGLLGVNKLTDLTLDITAAAAGSDVQRKAMIYGKTASNEPRRLAIPGPSAGVVTEQTEEGERVTTASGDAICGYWSTMAGETINFVDGVVVERE